MLLGIGVSVSLSAMKFTVITPAMNCADLLERNFKSVASQNFGKEDLEQWVVDGGSEDGTIDVLKSHSDVGWVSEADRGLSHAVNKGIKLAKGEWICWLNADDELAPGALQSFIDRRRDFSDGRIFVGDQAYYGFNGQLKTIVPGREYTFDDLTGGHFDINQPAMVVHRDVYAEVGGMDERYRYAMDYEWAVRAVRRYKCFYIPLTMAHCHMRRGSITDVNKAGAMREIALVRRMYGLSRFSVTDAKINAYLWTEPFRKIGFLRSVVRKAKKAIDIPVPIDGS